MMPVLDLIKGEACLDFCMAFAYTKYNYNYVIIGENFDILNYLQKKEKLYFVNMLHYSGKNRIGNRWHFFNNRYIIVEPHENKHRKWLINDKFTSQTVMQFRKLPKRWIADFDKLK
jgi:hypothetical protein